MKILTVVLAGLLVAGCSGHTPKDSERRQFFHPVRQLPPEPVYDRLRYVNPPQVLPDDTAPERSADTLRPTLHLDIAHSTLGHTAVALAQTVGYTASTDASIESRPYSCNVSGSVDAIGETIAREAGIQVVVDHERREVRFLPAAAVVPRLQEDSNEHQSDH